MGSNAHAGPSQHPATYWCLPFGGNPQFQSSARCEVDYIRAMSLTNKALFIIERNLGRDLSLGGIAGHCGVSRFHLVRAFGEATGYSLMDYVRGRRLTEAARLLAGGAEDILTVALDHQYGSHEAFSRAFKIRFNTTPDELRRTGSVEGLALIEPISLTEGNVMKLAEPKIEKVGELLFVGLSQRIGFEETQKIAGQWQLFMSSSYAEIENKISEPPVGVTTGADSDGIDYMCAAGVTKFGDVPKKCVKLTVSPATYAVFAHEGHVTEMRETYDAIWNEWFPKSGKVPADAPGLERHNPSFDPRTGNGGVTIWLPVVT
jgi:AraC family transcriptional regulator